MSNFPDIYCQANYFITRYILIIFDTKTGSVVEYITIMFPNQYSIIIIITTTGPLEKEAVS